MIQASQLHFRIGHQSILQEVSVVAPPGSVSIILGGNGAGKSSLFRILSGERTAQQGRVQVLGKDLIEWPRQALSRVRAVVSQSNALNFPFTVREIVEMGRSPHRDEPHAPHQQAVAAALAQADLLPLADRNYLTLSGGEKQRTHLARCLAQLHEAIQSGEGCLLLDEPTASLDIGHQHDCLSICQSLAKTGLTVLVILHDINLAARYGDHIILLKKGRVMAAGAPAEALTPEWLSATYDRSIQCYEERPFFDLADTG